MRATFIEMKHWMSHVQTRLELSPLTIVAGPNGAGKSGIAEAIDFVMMAVLPRVESKGERDALLTSGATGGGSVAIGDEKITIERDISTGKLVRPGMLPLPETAVKEVMPYLVQTSRFAAAEPDKRRSLLFRAMRVNLGSAGICAELTKRGLPKAQVEQLAAIESIEEMAKKASTGATEARGAWKAHTGETYGSQKAEAWRAPAAEAPTDDAIVAADVARRAAIDEVSDLQRTLGAIDAQAAAGTRQASYRENLKSKIVLKEAAIEQIEARKADLTKAEEAYDRALKEAQAVKARLPAPHLTCPCCRTTLQYQNEPPALHRYAVPDGPSTPADVAEADRTTAAANRALIDAQELLAGAQNTLREATQAEDALAAMDPASGSAEPIIRRSDIEGQLAGARNEVDRLTKAHADLLMQKRAAGEAGDKTRRAAAAHHLVQTWTKIGELVAPGGIPGELLSRALGPFNETLRELATVPGWRQVRIEENMTITADGRPYRLLCESERWRADVMLGLALAKHSELRILVIDRFDVLEPALRGPALSWLYRLVVKDGYLDTCVLMATLKERLKAPPGVTSHWLGQPQPIQAETKEAA